MRPCRVLRPLPVAQQPQSHAPRGAAFRLSPLRESGPRGSGMQTGPVARVLRGIVSCGGPPGGGRAGAERCAARADRGVSRGARVAGEWQRFGRSRCRGCGSNGSGACGPWRRRRGRGGGAAAEQGRQEESQEEGQEGQERRGGARGRERLGRLGLAAKGASDAEDSQAGHTRPRGGVRNTRQNGSKKDTLFNYPMHNVSLPDPQRPFRTRRSAPPPRATAGPPRTPRRRRRSRR
jgi:hypothetical protein